MIRTSAVELSRYSFPEEVIKLEEEWGDYLLKEKQMDQAIAHYIESGKSVKALDAAITARQWNKAVQIIDSVENPEIAKDYYGKIAQHYASVQDYERAERFFVEAGLQKEAVEMYNKAGQWQKAHSLASEYLEGEQSRELYAEQAAKLEEEGRWAEAEQLYCATNQANKAIAMYKRAGHYEPMMRLVAQFHPDHLQDTHLHLAKELEEEGRLVDAERHFLDGGDWKGAVSMYRAAEQWDDAYRLAKQHGGDVAQRQVAYLWAKHLGGDSAVKLLNKFGLLEEAIDYAADNGAFDFAFDLCRLGLKSKTETVHWKKALQLEEEGSNAEAEQHFLLAKKPKEAVLMYVHQRDWDSAQRLAEEHCPEAIAEVYVGQARLAFEARDYPKAESYLLRAQRPEIIVKTYKELSMWPEALRVCKDYLPGQLAQLQEEYDHEQLKSGAKGAESYMAQAKEWESQADYERAIDAYMKVNKPLTQNERMMETAWSKAADLAIKFLSEEQGTQVVNEMAERLVDINKHNAAAEMLLQGGLLREAVDAFMAGGEWSKAKKVAVQTDRELEQYVDERYKTFLRTEGKAEELATVDVISAIDMHVEKGQWTKALDIAKEQQNRALLDKYVALYCSELVAAEKFKEAVEIFVQYGTSANKQNFNMYKRLIDSAIAARDTMNAEGYLLFGPLRDMLLDLVNKIRVRTLEFVSTAKVYLVKVGKLHSDGDGSLDPRYIEVFENYLSICHFYALRSALLGAVDQDEAYKLFATKISVALLRHSDLILADKAFYEAGMACKDMGGAYEAMAFAFMNHYLDLAEAIEEQNAERVDNSDFEDTDIPLEIPLPEQLYLSEEQHEETKDWVLAISVDANVEKQLLKDSRGVYEASLGDPGQQVLAPCLVTAYPVLGAAKQFGSSGKCANKDDWNKLIMVQKSANDEQIKDVLRFISVWTRTETSMAL